MKRLSLLLPFALLFGCASEEKPLPAEEHPVVYNDSLDKAYQEVVTPELNPLPSPLQIAFLFKQSGLEYQVDVANNVENGLKYTTTIAKQLNLGVYSADFAYCALNQQKSVGMSYLKVIEEVADDLGLAGAYNTVENRDRFEANADDIDSVAAIISELQIEADQYFLDNNEQDKAYVIFAGAWLESMYLGAATKDLSDNPGLAGTLMEQSDILGDLLAALGTIETDPQLDNLIASLSEIKSLLTEMQGDGSEEGETIVSADQLYQLINLIFTARKSIVEP